MTVEPVASSAVEDSPDGLVDGADARTASAHHRATFEVRLENFSGPFDLLLSLIAKHKMDVTEVALAVVTDDFIAHIRGQEEWDLSQASEFLVIASTLLDLKAARLLPRGAVEDAEDLELLEARDLLFARLLQYRAFKEVAAHLGAAWERAGRAHPREVALEPRFAALLPELIMQIGPEDLAALAAQALAPKPAAEGVDISHLHNPAVSVREQAAMMVDRLRRSRSLSFRTLTDDADGTPVVVARFLALLELYREGAIGFDQADPLGELTVRWTGADAGDVDVIDDYDDSGGAVDAGAGGEETENSDDTQEGPG
ncbi:segregation and condensation protein A [Ruania alba]|uniref:segregation and condensation protein A n=1 Tax=Ruania alba TaxID=648782 RepID=UPI000B7EE740